MKRGTLVTLRRVLLLTWAFAFLSYGECIAATKPKKTAQKKPVKTTKKVTITEKALDSNPSEATPTAKADAKRAPVNKGSMLEVEPVAEVGDVKHYKYKLNTSLGIDIVSGLGSAFHIGGQLGFAVWDGVPFYVGPDVGFSLFSPANTISTAASTWYELRIYGAPRLSMSIGAGLGPVIASSTKQFSSLTYQAFLDGCIVQEINDLASVRGQFRPAVVGGYFGFNVNLNVQFRFQ